MCIRDSLWPAAAGRQSLSQPRVYLKTPNAPGQRTFSRCAAPFFLEIRQYSCEKMSCSAQKFLAAGHIGSFQIHPSGCQLPLHKGAFLRFYLRAAVIVAQDRLIVEAEAGDGVGAVLAHADAVAVAAHVEAEDTDVYKRQCRRWCSCSRCRSRRRRAHGRPDAGAGPWHARRFRPQASESCPGPTRAQQRTSATPSPAFLTYIQMILYQMSKRSASKKVMEHPGKKK